MARVTYGRWRCTALAADVVSRPKIPKTVTNPTAIAAVAVSARPNDDILLVAPSRTTTVR